MVRVAANGEVVNDDIPLNAPNNRRAQSSGAPHSSAQPPRSQGQAGDPFSNAWNTVNERLTQFGLHTFNVAGFNIEPAHLVAGILAFLLFGPMAFIVVAVLLVVSQYNSRQDNHSNSVASSETRDRDEGRPPRQRPSPNVGNATKSLFSGTGQKLGK